MADICATAGALRRDVGASKALYRVNIESLLRLTKQVFLNTQAPKILLCNSRCAWQGPIARARWAEGPA